MAPSNPWNSYRRVATQTATPGQLILQLYDGAVRFLEAALAGFAHDDPVEFNATINSNVQRAQEIIRELSISLNVEAGGEFAWTLRRLYDYFDRRLMESNMRKDQEGIREVIQSITVLRDAWATMLQRGSGAPSDEPMSRVAA